METVRKTMNLFVFHNFILLYLLNQHKIFFLIILIVYSWNVLRLSVAAWFTGLSLDVYQQVSVTALFFKSIFY